MESRYRDRDLILFQIEYRFAPIFLMIVDVYFFSIGLVSAYFLKEFNSNELKYGYDILNLELILKLLIKRNILCLGLI